MLLPNRQLRRLSWPVCSNAAQWVENVGIPIIATSQAWQVNYQIVYSPVYVPYPGRYKLKWLNGAAVAGLIAWGVYRADSEGKPSNLIPTLYGLEAQSGTNTPQGPTNMPAVWLDAGLHFIAIQCSTTTAQVIAVAALSANYMYQLGGIFTEQPAASGLPAVATPVTAPTACKVPWVCLWQWV